MSLREPHNGCGDDRAFAGPIGFAATFGFCDAGSWDNAGCQVQIDHGGVQAAMTEVLLDAADVYPGLQQMSGIAVPERMNGDAFCDVKLFQYPLQGALHGGLCHGSGSCGSFFAAATRAGKDPGRITMMLPVFAQ